jgi:cyclopropane fatty-acyl-phospholipid synthase-like methyltransferase
MLSARSAVGLTRLFYELRYILSHPPWDTGVTPPEVVEYITDGRVVPGRALDLGCGTGTNCVALARQGWEPVGVDFSLLAIRRARRRARRAGVAARFYRADVADLSFLTGPFDLVVDIGCLHSVPRERHEAYAREVARLSRPGALYMLYAFTPREARGQTLGLSPERVRALFGPAFELERQEGGEDPTGPSSAWYWLRRH